MKKFEILDCTLRDGGYYNNWNFDKKTIQEYLEAISRSQIKFVELGFRFNDTNKNKGLTAYTEDKLINKLNIPNNIRIGIMINASDLLSEYKNKVSLKVLKRIFPSSISKKIYFVRIACHHEEVFKLNILFNYLKKFNIRVFINIMQISELEENKLSQICGFLKNKKVYALYLADSLGALTLKKMKNLIKTLKQYWDKEIGLHAHDNLKFALKNSIFAIQNGVHWIDSTLTGMGRGPGNLKTEEIIKFSSIYKEVKEFKFIVKKFNKLKKIYGWGTNIYYEMAAKRKIHPTYIQKILSDSRYKKNDYIKIIKELSKSGSSKFNPYNLINSAYFISGKPQGNLNSLKLLKNKDILIVGPGKNLSVNFKKIENFIKIKKLFVIGLNLHPSLKEKLIDLRVSCHPFRIMSDKIKYSKLKTKIVIPYSMLNKTLRKSLNIKKNFYYDYGFKLDPKKKYLIKKNFCSLPFPLAIGYALSLSVTGQAKSISVAGFDGYDKSDTDQDETEEIFNYFKNKYLKNKIKSLTKTKFKSLNY